MLVRQRQQRKTHRKSMRYAAWLRTSDRGIPVPCVVWDLSEGGARLTSAQSESLPGVFTLILAKNGDSHRLCRVVWRKKPHVGVRFVELAEFERMMDGVASGRSGPAATGQCDPAEFAQTVAMARQAVSLQIRNSDVASGARRKPLSTSTVALMLLILLALSTLVFNVAAVGFADGRHWATAVCTTAANFCAHPEWSGIAAVLMAFVYLSVKGMER
jgi:hypothetical protein